MSDYISREAALALAESEEYITPDGDEIYHEYIPVSAVKRIPAADVRPVEKAKIVDMRYTEDDGEWKCSHCGLQYTLSICGKDVTNKIHFCPNCGADMREES